jgi:hypothetical protein
MTIAKIWNGSSWFAPSVFNRPKIWNGSIWVPSDPKIWNGTSWNPPQETQTVTVGVFTFKDISNYGYGGFYGSISDGTFGFISNAPINQLVWSNVSNGITFTLNGNRANSGWTKMTISGNDYTRATASYGYDVDNDRTLWFMVGPNPFGETVGVTVPVVFTQ